MKYELNKLYKEISIPDKYFDLVIVDPYYRLGFELDENYFNIAKKRIEETIKEKKEGLV